jgi:hypothetical protein
MMAAFYHTIMNGSKSISMLYISLVFVGIRYTSCFQPGAIEISFQFYHKATSDQ